MTKVLRIMQYFVSLSAALFACVIYLAIFVPKAVATLTAIAWIFFIPSIIIVGLVDMGLSWIIKSKIYRIQALVACVAHCLLYSLFALPSPFHEWLWKRAGLI